MDLYRLRVNAPFDAGEVMCATKMGVVDAVVALVRAGAAGLVCLLEAKGAGEGDGDLKSANRPSGLSN